VEKNSQTHREVKDVSNKDVRQDALDNLADALTEDILNTPDDEVLREVAEDYGDPRALANKFDQILERAEKQAFGAARPAASPKTQSSFQAQSSVPYYRERILDWLSTLFGNRMVLAGAAAVLIVLILGPAVFLSISELNERSRQLAALEKEQLARSEQLAAQERELLARSERLVAREKEVFGNVPATQAQAAPEPVEAPAEAAPPIAEVPAKRAPEIGPKVTLCESTSHEFAALICADANLAFWQNLVREIYEHRWQQLDANGQQILRQAQLDWLRKLPVDCNVPETNAWKAGTRARSCVLKSTKKRVAVLINN
jgi:uncharacterized protein YecT (DUF1311 family)